MKITAPIRLFINRAILLLNVLAFIITRADARIIEVGSHFATKRIHEAIRVAHNGDTVMIHGGHYAEGNIVIEKSITLLGINEPVLDGEGKYEILTIHADHVVISGFRFEHTGVASMQDLAAIKVLNSKYVRIQFNQMHAAFFGIYFANSSESWIEHNVLRGEANSEDQIGNGIHLWKCQHMTVTNNNIKGQRDGIYFEFVTLSHIIGNHSEGNIRYGLHFMFSHDDEYRDNVFMKNGAGVAVMYTKGVKMIHNRFEENWGSSSYGLLLKEIRDSEVSGNQFVQNSVGIHMEGSSRITFKENLFTRNGYALRLQASCDENHFVRNNFLGNTFDLVTNGSLVLNTISGNYWDKYEGYDLNHDRIGDIPYHPVSLYGMVIENIPAAVMLWRSFLVLLMDRAEKAVPSMTPEGLKDNEPSMHPYDLVSEFK